VYVIQGIALGWVSHRMYAVPVERRVVAVIAGFVVVVSLVAR
jgi:hypothetical protein